MTEYLKVEGHSDLYRDPKTGAIINRNKTEYELYSLANRARMTDKMRLTHLEQEMSEIKDELNDIKLLLQKIIDK